MYVGVYADQADRSFLIRSSNVGAAFAHPADSANHGEEDADALPGVRAVGFLGVRGDDWATIGK